MNVVATAQVQTPAEIPSRLEFLQQLYGTGGPGHHVFWRRSDKRSKWIPAERPEDVGRIESDQDIYLSVALHDQHVALRLSTNNDPAYVRGSSGSAIAIGGLAADFDVQGPTHKSEKLPRTFAEAHAFIEDLPFVPTAIVHSGYGLQPWWFFDKLWVFEGAEDRDNAQTLARRFHATIQALAAQRGWSFDNTSDLARVLRLPETYNAKLPELAEVRVVLWRPDRRYAPSELEICLISTPTPPPAARVVFTGSLDRLTERARRWLAKRPPAIEGSGGDAWTYATAAYLLNDFDLPEDAAWSLLLDWNRACEPPWSERELRVKFDSAKRSPHRGQTLGRLRDAEPPGVQRRTQPRHRRSRKTSPRLTPGRRIIVEVG